MSGTLYVVATPIGNLRDITLRALDVLGEVDLVCAEDTRTARKLFAAHGITSPVTSLHAHTRPQKVKKLVDKLNAGSDIALISEAGTPGVSDPGGVLVSAAIEAGANVCAVPGPSAVTAAASASGFPMDSFCFLGFTQRRPERIREALRRALAHDMSVVFFESGGRLSESLKIAAQVAPRNRACVLREITKVHEEVVRGTVAELSKRFGADAVRGEVTVVIEGGGGVPARAQEEKARGAVRSALKMGLSARDTAALISKLLGLPKKRVYEIANEQSQSGEENVS